MDRTRNVGYRRVWTVLLIVLAALLLAGCGPEAERNLGDGAGSGADPGNRSTSVQLLGDTDRNERIFHETQIHALPRPDNAT